MQRVLCQLFRDTRRRDTRAVFVLVATALLLTLRVLILLLLILT